MTDDRRRIFLSYASEDSELVERLYESLRRRGLDPWMDRKDLAVGSRWEPAIVRALRSAAVIVICLSPRSATKRGFLQREIRQALSLEQERLPEDVYIIPAKLEDCRVPDQLAPFQWIDLSSSNGLDRLVETIERQLHSLRPSPSSSTPGIPEIFEERISWRPKTGADLAIDVSFPRLAGLGPDVLSEVNGRLGGIALEFLHRHRSVAIGVESPEEGDISYGPRAEGDFAGLTYRVGVLTASLLSLELYHTMYSQGAAHPLHLVSTLSLLLNPVCDVQLSDLFLPDSSYLDVLSSLSREQLTESLKLSATTPESDKEWVWRGTEPRVDNFRAAIISPKGVTIVFQEYQVAAYAAGTVYADIPWATLKPYMRRLPVLDAALNATV